MLKIVHIIIQYVYSRNVSISLPGKNGLGALAPVPTPTPKNSRTFYYKDCSRGTAPQLLYLALSPP